MPNEEIDALNAPAFDELQKHAAEGPVVMLNLLDFKPGGGRERYEKYGEAVAPLLERAGARVVYAGDAGGALICTRSTRSTSPPSVYSGTGAGRPRW
jgi:hypothetical protein